LKTSLEIRNGRFEIDFKETVQTYDVTLTIVKHNQIMQFTHNWIMKEALMTEVLVSTCQIT